MAKNSTSFKPGHNGGRPKGALNKATLEAREICAGMVDDPAYLSRLRERLLKGKLPPAVECMIWHYAKFKPTDRVQVEDVTPIPLVIDSVSTRAELLAALGAKDEDAGGDTDSDDD